MIISNIRNFSDIFFFVLIHISKNSSHTASNCCRLNFQNGNGNKKQSDLSIQKSEYVSSDGLSNEIKILSVQFSECDANGFIQQYQKKEHVCVLKGLWLQKKKIILNVKIHFHLVY